MWSPTTFGISTPARETQMRCFCLRISWWVWCRTAKTTPSADATVHNTPPGPFFSFSTRSLNNPHPVKGGWPLKNCPTTRRLLLS